MDTSLQNLLNINPKSFGSYVGELISSRTICGKTQSKQNIKDFIQHGREQGLKLSDRLVKKAKKCGYIDTIEATAKQTISSEDNSGFDIWTDKGLAELYLYKIKNAKRRHKEFTLTIADLKRITRRKTCYYTGLKMDVNDNRLKPTLERIDPAKGYTKENTVAVCSFVNQIKNELFENPEGDLRISQKHLVKMLSKL